MERNRGVDLDLCCCGGDFFFDRNICRNPDKGGGRIDDADAPQRR